MKSPLVPTFSLLRRTLGTAVILAGSTQLHAAVVNIDLGLRNNHPDGVTSVLYSGTAAAPDAGTVWNQLEVLDTSEYTGPEGEFGFWTATTTVPNLVDSTGSLTGLTVSAIATAGNTGAFGILAGSANLGTVARDAVNLMRDYLIGFNAPQMLELSGFAPLTVVDLYLYGAGDSANRDTLFAITDSNGPHSASTTGTISPDPNFPVAHNLTLGGDYVLLSGIIADGTGKISISYTSGGGSGEAPFNGLQAVFVPEPSATLFLCGTLSLMFRRRRSR